MGSCQATSILPDPVVMKLLNMHSLLFKDSTTTIRGSTIQLCALPVGFVVLMHFVLTLRRREGEIIVIRESVIDTCTIELSRYNVDSCIIRDLVGTNRKDKSVLFSVLGQVEFTTGQLHRCAVLVNVVPENECGKDLNHVSATIEVDFSNSGRICKNAVACLQCTDQ